MICIRGTGCIDRAHARACGDGSVCADYQMCSVKTKRCLSAKEAETERQVLAQEQQLARKVSAAIPRLPDKSAGFAGWKPGDPEIVDGPMGLGYCGDYARRIFEQASGHSLAASGANASDWYPDAKKKNLKTIGPDKAALASVPPGSLVIWQGGESGHVAVVTKNS